MNLIGIVLILTVGAAFIVMAVLQLLALIRKNDKAIFLKSIAYLFVIIGGGGFFGTTLSAVGGFNWLPKSFEWPIGKTRKAVKAGTFFVVPHTPSGRIQVYDLNWKFVRGWHVDGRGGAFKLIISPEGLLNIYTARGGRHYIYTIQGALVGAERASREGYAAYPETGITHFVPTAPWLIAFSHPLYSWVLVIIGIACLILMEKMERRQPIGHSSSQT